MAAAKGVEQIFDAKIYTKSGETKRGYAKAGTARVKAASMPEALAKLAPVLAKAENVDAPIRRIVVEGSTVIS